MNRDDTTSILRFQERKDDYDDELEVVVSNSIAKSVLFDVMSISLGNRTGPMKGV